MSTRRTPLRPSPRLRITPEVVALFRLAREIECSGDDQKWEEDGGRRREYLDSCVTLHRLLGRKLWQEDILNVETDEPPDYIARDPAQAADWQAARAIRRQLEAMLPTVAL